MLNSKIIKKAWQIRKAAAAKFNYNVMDVAWRICIEMAQNGEKVVVAKVRKQTMKKFNNWKESGTWGRIGINFTTKQRDELVAAGLCKAGLFGGIVDLDNTVDEETRNSLVESIKSQRIAMAIA